MKESKMSKVNYLKFVTLLSELWVDDESGKDIDRKLANLRLNILDHHCYDRRVLL